VRDNGICLVSLCTLHDKRCVHVVYKELTFGTGEKNGTKLTKSKDALPATPQKLAENPFLYGVLSLLKRIYAHDVRFEEINMP
jgi:hypothetical protein